MRGGEFSHSTAPVSEGSEPSTGRALGAGASAAFFMAPGLPFIATVGALSLIIIEGMALIIAPPSGITTEDDGSVPSLPGGLPFIAMAGALALIIIDGLALIIEPPPSGITTEDDGSAVILADAGWMRSTRLCSRDAVLASETWVRNPVSNPKKIATTATSTAAPRPRRTHSPAPSDRFMAVKTRPPMSSAKASEVAAPAA